MNHISLFSGIGGFDLAAKWMGWTNVAHVEKDEFCQKVLQKNFPNAKTFTDIKEFDGTEFRGTIDVISGGFPCQPFSIAGNRKGKNDDRFLWPEMLRVIREIQPTWIVGENVPGILTIEKGLVFERLCSDLENEGYEVQPFIVPACGIGAPHKRDRVWIIAYSDSAQRERKKRGFQPQFNDGNKGETITNANGFGCNNRSYIGKERHIQDNVNRDAEKDKQKRKGRKCRAGKIGEVTSNAYQFNDDTSRLYSSSISQQETYRVLKNSWEEFPSESPVCDGNDGIYARLVRFNRTKAIKAGGNAIVPQVAYQFFQVIQSCS